LEARKTGPWNVFSAFLYEYGEKAMGRVVQTAKKWRELCHHAAVRIPETEGPFSDARDRVGV
jgi:hypothetical protein